MQFTAEELRMLESAVRSQLGGTEQEQWTKLLALRTKLLYMLLNPPAVSNNDVGSDVSGGGAS